eukprot:282497-Rhodomonas_salina.1
MGMCGTEVAYGGRRGGYAAAGLFSTETACWGTICWVLRSRLGYELCGTQGGGVLGYEGRVWLLELNCDPVSPPTCLRRCYGMSGTEMPCGDRTSACSAKSTALRPRSRGFRVSGLGSRV